MPLKWKDVLNKPPPSLYVDRRSVWQGRLRIMYNVCALGAFSLVIYSCSQGKSDWVDYYGLKTEEEKNQSSGQYWKKAMNANNAKVYRISGFSGITEIDTNIDSTKKEE